MFQENPSQMSWAVFRLNVTNDAFVFSQEQKQTDFGQSLADSEIPQPSGIREEKKHKSEKVLPHT